jgi:hypothetical protein
MVDITFNGMTMEYGIVESRMDTALKAELESALPEAAEQDLLDAYLAAHKERFGKEFLQD